MSRSYSVATVAFAVDADPKWVDNVIARYDVPGVARNGRGVELAVSAHGLLTIAVLRRLVLDLGLPVAGALPVAAKIAAAPDAAARIGRDLHLRLDRGALERDLAARLVDAAETIPARRRGRPPRRRARAD